MWAIGGAVLLGSLAAEAKEAPPPPAQAPTTGESSPPADGRTAAWAAMWNEALGRTGTVELLSHGENGYRLLVTLKAPVEARGARAAAIRFRFSEIDTSKDEPVWTRPKATGRKGEAPVQVAVSARGIYWLPVARAAGSLAALGKRAPTFGDEGGGSVMARPEFTSPVTCFATTAKRRSAKPLEICLSPGLGIVAVKGLVPALPDLVFARPGLLGGE
jgi:hypothetical protein